MICKFILINQRRFYISKYKSRYENIIYKFTFINENIKYYKMDNEEIEEELDDEWLDKLKSIESDYNDFYKKNTENIELYFFYLNTNNEVETINKIQYILDNNSKISKNNIVKIIKENQNKNNKKYYLKYLVKYNITIDPEEIQHLLNVDNYEGKNYMSQETYNRDIYFSDSISILQDLNALYLIFSEINKKTSINTRKINIKRPQKDKSKITNNRLDKTRRKRV
tara:strand:+ start:884 stop:1558 length:675 start_codon:yes stop_codon:yes gene_type:complete